MKLKWWLSPLVWVVAFSSISAEIPDLVLPSGVGVNIHFVTGHERDLDLIAQAGFKFIRMDFAWGGMERKKGEYDWSGYEELLGNLERRGMRPIFILDYSNPLYEEAIESRNPVFGGTHKTTASPQHPESVEGFARWSAAAAKHFQGRHVVWEIWNEPNIHFWAPEPNVGQYVTLALATCKAIRQSAPDATIIAPATSGFPWSFLEEFFKSGVLDYLDGLSVHPYREYKQAPETASADYRRLRELVDKYASADKKGKIPLISGEWGYASHTKGVSLETQAAFAVRQQLSNLLNAVPISIWYDWKNDGEDAAEREHNFGTVLPDLAPKPAYKAIQTMTRELSGFRVERRVSTGNDKDFVLLCRDSSGKRKIAAWTTGEARTAKVKVTDGTEQELQLGAMPVYRAL
jgi:polysaccharide biosynthesis protein PslG